MKKLSAVLGLFAPIGLFVVALPNVVAILLLLLVPLSFFWQLALTGLAFLGAFFGATLPDDTGTKLIFGIWPL